MTATSQTLQMFAIWAYGFCCVALGLWLALELAEDAPHGA